MGVSTDAILFWGFHMPEDWDEDEAFGLVKGEFEDRYGGEYSHIYAERALGIKAPTVPYVEETKEEYSEYWGKCRDAEKVHGIEEGTHCSFDCPMRYFAVAESVIRAYRGGPEEIAHVDIGADWRAKLEAYCEVMGLEMQEPKWWLVSLWG